MLWWQSVIILQWLIIMRQTLSSGKSKEKDVPTSSQPTDPVDTEVEAAHHSLVWQEQ